MKEVIKKVGKEREMMQVVQLDDKHFVVTDFQGAIIEEHTTEKKALAALDKLSKKD